MWVSFLRARLIFWRFRGSLFFMRGGPQGGPPVAPPARPSVVAVFGMLLGRIPHQKIFLRSSNSAFSDRVFFAALKQCVFGPRLFFFFWALKQCVFGPRLFFGGRRPPPRCGSPCRFFWGLPPPPRCGSPAKKKSF